VADHIDEQKKEVRVFGSKADLFTFMADRFCRASDAAIRARGCFAAALSGGHTPVGLYTEIARIGRAVDWKRIHVFLVDERLVPYEDGRSNFGMIKKRLLDAVSIPGENVHPVPVDHADPHVCARIYEDDIRAFFHTSPGDMPRFDLVLLGIGEDGHTASLFPGMPPFGDITHVVGAVAEGRGRTGRVTLTLPVINNAREVVFLVTGKGKAPIVRHVVEERDSRLPASLVAPAEGRLSFFCDRDAASELAARGPRAQKLFAKEEGDD
jgi:6-phosphogluconolactonase